MKKWIAMCSVVTVLVVGAAACGGSSDKESAGSTTTVAASAAGATAATVAGSSAPAVNVYCQKVNALVAAVNAKDVAAVQAAKSDIAAANEAALTATIGNMSAADEYQACLKGAGTALRNSNLNLPG